MSNMTSIGKTNDTSNQIKRDTFYVETKEDGTVILDKTRELPVVNFKCLVKLHGTFAGVKYTKKAGIQAMSKGNIITPQSDNAGFAFFVQQNLDYFEFMLSELIKNTETKEINLMGEWAGPGVQKGVGINLIPEKSFFMFGLKFKNEEKSEWAIDPSVVLRKIAEKDRIYSLYDFLTYDVEIDFNNPTQAKKELDEIRDQIDKECPVAKALGYIGNGEGIICTGYVNDQRYIFKHKGESHSRKKPKQKKELDPKQQEKLQTAETVTPAWRIEQGIQEIADTNNNGVLEMKHLGDVIKWVISDVIKEDIDVLTEDGFEIKEIQGFISKIVRDYVKEEIEGSI